MNTAIVHFSGLNTDPAGDCCGMRPFWEDLASLLGGYFTAIAWNDPLAAATLSTVASPADVLYASGHSHGASKLYDLLESGTVRGASVAAFLDLAPPGGLIEWMERALPTPPTVDNGIWFYQRNDVPLAGVAGIASPTTRVFDVSSWGLHHSNMCADERVQSRIKEQVLWNHVQRLRKYYQSLGTAVSG